MQLLVNWREQVVRQGDRTYRTSDGRVYEISLTGTCIMKCHTVKADFCDRCHTYAAVKGPYCWDCHVDPKLVRQWGKSPDLPTDKPGGISYRAGRASP
jgi:hypothetical protein